MTMDTSNWKTYDKPWKAVIKPAKIDLQIIPIRYLIYVNCLHPDIIVELNGDFGNKMTYFSGVVKSLPKPENT